MALVVLLLVVGLSAVALVAYAQYRRRQARVGALLALAQCWLDAFHAHVPQVVYSTYPPR